MLSKLLTWLGIRPREVLLFYAYRPDLYLPGTEVYSLGRTVAELPFGLYRVTRVDEHDHESVGGLRVYEVYGVLVR